MHSFNGLLSVFILFSVFFTFCSPEKSVSEDSISEKVSEFNTKKDEIKQDGSEPVKQKKEVKKTETEQIDEYNKHYKLWDSILKKIVTVGTRQGIKTTLIDYSKVRNNKDFDRLFSWYAGAEMPDNYRKKYAFLVNAYNIYTIKLMAEKSKGRSIMKIDGGRAFDKRYYKIASRQVSLNEIEKQKIKALGRPEYHFALVCAALSCPDLSRTAYTPKNVFWLMKRQAEKFFHNETKGLKIDQESKIVYLTTLAKWYGDEFKSKGGFREYAASFFENVDKKKAITSFEVKYIPYNWSTNGI